MTTKIDVPPELASVPPDWTTPELLEALQRRDALAAAAAAVDHAVAYARGRRDQALAAVTAGGTAAADELVGACGEVVGAEAARGLLPAAVLDVSAVAEPLSRASGALDKAGRELALVPLDVLVETVAWHQHVERIGRPVDPPIVTDAERALSRLLPAMIARCEKWAASRITWGADVAQHRGDPVDFLASAAGQVKQAAVLAVDVAALNLKIETANAERRAAGRTWSPFAAATG